MAGSQLRSWPRERARTAGIGVGAYLGGSRFWGAQKCAGSGAQEGRGGRRVGAAVVAAPCSVVAVGCKGLWDVSRKERWGSLCSVPPQQAAQVVLGRERVKGGWGVPSPYERLSGAVGASAFVFKESF